MLSARKTIAGFSLYDAEFPVIYVNNSNPNERGRYFTLFHELGHLLYRTSGVDIALKNYRSALPAEYTSH